MAVKISPEFDAGPLRLVELPLAAQLERLAAQLDRGLISPDRHAIEKARLLASNTP